MTMLKPVGITIAVTCGAFAVGCGGGGSSPPPPPPGHAPVIANFTATPSWVTTGQTASLNWSVTDATSLSISTIGTVSGTGTTVTPAADSNYVLTASNSYGSTEAQVELPVFPPPTTWFAPIGDTSAIPYVHGASDYFELFSPNAAWPRAASHVSVFKMYSQMLDLDDATLRSVFADLHRRHIAFAIEWGPLDGGGTCGAGIEGFTGGAALHYAQRIRDLGGSLQYVAFDEPVGGATLYDGAGACHWTPLQTAQNAAANVAQILSVFPDAHVGDIEGLPNGDSWLSAYSQFVDAWQAVTGKPLAFFHLDVDWGQDWKPAAAALTQMLKKRNIPIGHIYNGGGGTSDASWIALAEQHMADFETHAALTPDEAIFQSWMPYPKHLLPETDPTSFTYLLDQYFRARTSLTLSAVIAPGQGTLKSAAGPVANAAVTLTEVPLTGSGAPSVYTYSDVIPGGAQYVVFGARVAAENCSSVAPPAEFYLTSFTLDAGAAGQLSADFSNGLTGWGIWGNAAIAQVENGMLHVQVLPGETMGLNSASLPFAAAGAPYTLSVTATIPPGSAGSGCVIAVFQDSSVTEIARAAIRIAPQPIGFGSQQTDATGTFAFNLAAPAGPQVLWADYAGSDSLWPAASAILLNPTAPVTITTGSLLDATVGTAYSQPLGASGGRAPYLWAGGVMPPGLLLSQDGTLSGTPTKAGSYALAVSVVDDSDPAQLAGTTLNLTIH